MVILQPSPRQQLSIKQGCRAPELLFLLGLTEPLSARISDGPVMVILVVDRMVEFVSLFISQDNDVCKFLWPLQELVDKLKPGSPVQGNQGLHLLQLPRPCLPDC